jgi:hypothetical protein
MHLNNKMLGIRRRIGHLLAAFLLGAALGLVVFYWFSVHAFDFGIIFMDIISVIQTLIFSLIIYVLFFLITFIFYKNKRPKISSVNYLLFGMGWLMAIVLTIVLYPGDHRYLNPPKIVRQQAKLLEKQLAQYPILWEMGMDNPRKEESFELKPKIKSTGYMPYSDTPWEMVWSVYYNDGTWVNTTFFLNGVEPARFYSVNFDYSNSGAWWQPPAADMYSSQPPKNDSLLALPWAWILADPNQRPSHFELLLPKEDGETAVMATYSGSVQLHWKRKLFLGTETLTVWQQNIKSPCREGWSQLNICIPLKSSQAVPPGLLLY